METRPTKSEIGKTQKMVKALRWITVRAEVYRAKKKSYQTPRLITQSLTNWIWERVNKRPEEPVKNQENTNL